MQRPKIVPISPFSLQYQGNATNLGSLGKDSGRCIYVSCNSLSHQIMFGWDNAGLLQRRSALQCVVEATTMVVAITRARVAIVVFATTLVRCNKHQGNGIFLLQQYILQRYPVVAITHITLQYHCKIQQQFGTRCYILRGYHNITSSRRYTP